MNSLRSSEKNVCTLWQQREQRIKLLSLALGVACVLCVMFYFRRIPKSTLLKTLRSKDKIKV